MASAEITCDTCGTTGRVALKDAGQIPTTCAACVAAKTDPIIAAAADKAAAELVKTKQQAVEDIAEAKVAEADAAVAAAESTLVSAKAAQVAVKKDAAEKIHAVKPPKVVAEKPKIAAKAEEKHEPTPSYTVPEQRSGSSFGR